ncbi:MAG TPA: uroporphyrinogen-III C-methyltransferase [Candidatus Acidoferrum sp.]|jgi:uroporphyrin-III C-methyltransferase
MGTVFLVGAGPGDPELLTIKAARLLEHATVVLHDSLVSREVLALIPATAEIIDVGKRAGQKLLTQDEINSLLVSYASSHEVVIRLKGGDPTLFGRAGEEIEALRKAQVPYEIVPGITAALGAAAAAGISLTDRRAASQLVITTYSRGTDAANLPGADASAANADPFAVTHQLNWAAIAATTTLVLYMPTGDYAEVSRRLRAAGQPEDLPCAIVSNATRPNQQIRHTTVAGLASEAKLPAPALLIVGRVTAKTLDQVTAASASHPVAAIASQIAGFKSQ